MFSHHIRRYIPLGLALLPIFTLATPSSRNEAESDYATFQRLLEQVDPPSLHAALHDHSPKFKHGMFREDKSAVEVIHRDDASLATSIIKLAKRQDNVNGTVISPVTPTNSPTPIIESATPSAAASSADEANNAATVTTESIPNDRTSEGAVLTPSTESTPIADSTTPPVTVTSTSTESAPDASSEAPPPNSSIESRSRPAGSVFTFTDSAGIIIVTTVGGEASTIGPASSSPSVTASDSGVTVSSEGSVTSKPASRSSVYVQTTTLPDGRRSTITAVTVVRGDGDSATPTGDAGVASETQTGSTTPGVQTGLAGRTGNMMKEMLCMVGGAMGVAMLM